MQPPFPNAEAALRYAFHTLANSDMGMRGTLVPSVGGGAGPVAEQFAQAGMIVNEVKARMYDPYRAAIIGGMLVVGWNDQGAWQRRHEKFSALMVLGSGIECRSETYKRHALGAWSGLHPLDDDKWAERLRVTSRTLRNWRLAERGIWTTADTWLRVALNIADSELRVAGIVE